MGNELTFDVAISVEPGACILEASDSGGEYPIRTRKNHLVIFVSQGGLVLNRARTGLELASGQAYVGEAGAQLSLDVRKDTEYYLLSFNVVGGHESEGVRLEISPLSQVRRPDRLTCLLRRYLLLRERGGRPAQMCELLVLILRELALSEATFDVSAQEAKVAAAIALRVDAYIAAHYRHHIGTPDIAAELHYNAEYLERAYRQQRHLSIRDAIHLRRVREAGAQLLLHKERCVSEIARMCGYRDANYFRRVFKQTMKMTPNRFRYAHATAGDEGGGRKAADVPA